MNFVALQVLSFSLLFSVFCDEKYEQENYNFFRNKKKQRSYGIAMVARVFS